MLGQVSAQRLHVGLGGLGECEAQGHQLTGGIVDEHDQGAARTATLEQYGFTECVPFYHMTEFQYGGFIRDGISHGVSRRSAPARPDTGGVGAAEPTGVPSAIIHWRSVSAESLCPRWAASFSQVSVGPKSG